MGKIKKNANSLRWRFDVNTFRLLGRELITDRITAVFELVKNCYDANATEVVVYFNNVAPDKNIGPEIIISDNGVGMSFIDIRDKWMVVGTNSKRTKSYSPGPFNRKFVGEKGIGRFAVDKLGERVVIKTKELNDDKWLNVTINWDEYESLSKQQAKPQLSLFTDVDNLYNYTDANPNEHGTSLIISKVSEPWTSKDIERLYKELSRLTSPFYPLNPPFNIFISSNEYPEYHHKPVKPDPIKFYTYFKEVGIDETTGLQEVMRFDRHSGKIVTELTEIKSFGPVRLRIYYFNEAAKRRYNTLYKNDDTRIDGIKIYRDGIIATPFAEYEDDAGKKRDILGIDKRRWGSAFDKVSTREIIGVLDITKINNPKIIDSTNRQDFLDNPEYRKLKEFIIDQVDVFGDFKKYARDLIRTDVERDLLKAGQDVKSFTRTIEKIERDWFQDKPQFKQVLEPLKLQATSLSSVISQSINEQKKFQKDVIRKENVYLSLMSLQDYAANISHAIRTSLGKIKRMAEFFKINFPNAKFDALFKQYALLIYDEMNTLIKVTDFMLSYASSDIDFEDFSVKELLENLLLDAYRQTFAAEGIKVTVDIKDDFIINTNKKFFEDIFQNLVSNSIKALQRTADKIIKCSGYLDDEHFTLYFSDNGTGIDDDDAKWIFGLYNTRTSEQGGSGLGLYIVEKRIEALKGSVDLVQSEYKPGATFKITLPFNKDI
ncbi:sensor histidine kinase [Mucilaginibacter galii]|uniref:histidine kinase n=1 Tax=Mucilaginibacter galii TaxID=2005073 RepID=A0A917JD64_9SPHI|nr:sensor histidine kinase [Mucilaginibacter galii]GGI52397.1 histidine kinase [Mucilaginibacter galii]